MRKYIKPELDVVKFDVEEPTLTGVSAVGDLIFYGDGLGTVDLNEVKDGKASFTIIQ